MSEKPDYPKAKINPLYVAALQPFMAKHDIRYYLEGINIEPCKDGGINMAATDGHRALVIHDPKGYASRQFIMPVSTALMQVCKKRHTKKVIDLGEHTSSLLIQNGMLYAMRGSAEDEALDAPSPEQINVAYPIKEIDARYPDYKEVFKKAFQLEDQRASSVFDSAYIADFKTAASYLSGYNANWTTILIHTRQQAEASVVTFNTELNEDGATAIGLIMPVREEGTALLKKLPDFLKPQSTKKKLKKAA